MKEAKWKNLLIIILVIIIIIETILLLNNKDIRFSSDDEIIEKNKFNAETTEIIRGLNIAYFESMLDICIEAREGAYYGFISDELLEEDSDETIAPDIPDWIVALEETCNELEELINQLSAD